MNTILINCYILELLQKNDILFVHFHISSQSKKDDILC